ncbi:TonB-linked SusC/RagA family outer membrane protein [Mucilaginibacter gracilis]|uniref:TonB-linked SusC/RagA family outer membrane protein n=1 Tax=Mucilaginibacter gracilis TaxID=423350 RepID=A0A495IW85_9SPHI|nr:TonB-dependent receptor [Mucilaginibacter gracilis]RKR80129.1 TonB-linked SusC/RagA family outer membrane protein [Mucilaginibacter gracilis]
MEPQNLNSNWKHFKVFLHFKTLFILLIFMLSADSLFSQTKGIKISGVVTDAQRQPLIGVTVRVKSAQTATSTDANGKYQITVADNSAILAFSYLGFVTQQQAVNGKSIINVALAEESSGLNEVVVIGYGTSKKKDLTGSVAQVNMPDLTKAPVMSIDQALAGRVAGVQVNSSDGQPGSAVNIVIRGANSITQDNSPLYVVDGFPIEGFNLNTFNPQDIESIDVLKDASSTAIYGARGANGIIIITTKKGKAGSPQTTFTTTQSFSKNTKTMKLMDAYEFLKYQIELTPGLGSAAAPTPTYTYLTAPGKTLDDYKDYPATDWQSPFFKTGSLRNYSLAVRGGTKETLYSVSGSVDNLDGTILATSYKRYQGRITLDQNLTNKVKVGVNANYAYLSQAGNSVSASTNSGTTNILYSVWGYNPLSAFSSDQAIDATTATANDYKFNPVLNQENLVRNVKTNSLNVNTYLLYAITPDLTLKVTGVLNNSTVNNENFNNSNTYYGSPLTNAGQTSGVNGSVLTSKTNNWANENTLTYSHIFNKVHNINVVGGFSELGITSSTSGFGANFLPNESLGINGLDEGTINPALTKQTSSLSNGASFLGRINYNYNSKYYLTLSYRADGSSKFSEKNHWSYFPSGALAWRFKQESFLKDAQWLSEGKLRLGYGKTGNNRVSDFPYLSTSGVTPAKSYSFNNTYISSIIPLTIGNPDLKWETTDQYNVGIDAGFLNNRISLTADVYRKTTKNLLLNATLPTSTGYTSAFENVGSVQNQGLELTLNTVNIDSKQFKWTSSINISFNQNKVLALANNQESMTTALAWDNGWSAIPGYIAKVGQPLGLMYGYLADGVYQYSDFNKTSTGTYVLKDNVPTNGNTRTTIQPGDIKYKDINGDGVVNASDYTIIGRSLPIHTGGFNNNFTYKNFDLNIFFQWSYGNNIQDANNILFNAKGGTYLEAFASYADRWSPTNQNSTINRAGGYFGGGYSSNTVQDGSYLRLKTASLGYNIPKKWLKRINVSSLRVYASGQNLLTWTNYTGLDPEVSTYNSVLTGGFDYSAYPRARTIAFGVNLTL